MRRAHETDDIGRSIVKYSFDVDELLHVSRVIEQIKVTVTIRSARDTFREQMCGTIIEWLGDIAQCSVGPDHDILRQVICEEMLKPWSTGSEASNRDVGMKGIDDHETDEQNDFRRLLIHRQQEVLRQAALVATVDLDQDLDDDDDEGPDIEVEVEVMEDDGGMSSPGVY
jgi:E3 ubiquitin-protein ligase UBR1